MRTEKHHVKKFAKFTEVTGLGPANVRLMSVSDQAALRTVRQVSPNSELNYYKTIAVNGCSWSYLQQNKTKKQLYCAFDGWEYF